VLIIGPASEASRFQPKANSRNAEDHGEHARYGSGNRGNPIRDLDRIGLGMFFGFFGGLGLFGAGLGLWLYARRWRGFGFVVGVSGLGWATYALFWPLLTWGG